MAPAEKNIYLSDIRYFAPASPNSVYFVTLYEGGCKKPSRDFMWLAPVPVEPRRSCRQHGFAPLASSRGFCGSEVERNVVQRWSVTASVGVRAHGGASDENQAEEEPPAVGQRCLGCLLTCAAPFRFQERHGSLLPEGLQQRPGAGVQPWAETRQRRCQGEYSTHMQMGSLTAEGRSRL